MTLLAAAQNVWRRLPLRFRRLAAPLLGRATQSYARAGRPVAVAARHPLPIKIVGLFSAPSGIGASARLAVRAFEALGIPVEAVDASAQGLDFSRRLSGAPEPAIWIFHLNPSELLAALASLGPKKVVGPRYGYWAWELPKAPGQWLSDARAVDEVWTPSRYSADALAGADAPVRVVPHPLFVRDYEDVEPLPRRAPFQAVAVFDFRSSMARKNPLAAIEAFRRAFQGDPACDLTLKTQNGQDFPEQLEALRAAIPSNARLIDEIWPYAEVKRLIAGADVLISLHRAEGFGLTPAEAMALGTPVLATAYSGVLDFLDDSCAILVPFALTPVDDPQGVYRGQAWAEPDLDAAAAGLRRLREDAWLRSTLAEAARRRVAERLSPTAWLANLPETIRARAVR